MEIVIKYKKEEVFRKKGKAKTVMRAFHRFLDNSTLLNELAKEVPKAG